MKKIQAQYLKVGDETTIGEKVVVAPSVGINTPSRKVDLVVEKNGKRYPKQWNKTTEIGIKETAK